MGVAGVLFIYDINFAALWGLLTFFLGFIPYLGIFLAAVPPILVAWSMYGIESDNNGSILHSYKYHFGKLYIPPINWKRTSNINLRGIYLSIYMGLDIRRRRIPVRCAINHDPIKYLEKFKETRWLALLMINDENPDEEKLEIKENKNPE